MPLRVALEEPYPNKTPQLGMTVGDTKPGTGGSGSSPSKPWAIVKLERGPDSPLRDIGEVLEGNAHGKVRP